MATRDRESIEKDAEVRHAEEIARAHEALAAAQDRAYWLDRWGVDLNVLMRAPGADAVRRALRALRMVWRKLAEAQRASKGARGKIQRAVRPEPIPAAAPKLSVFKRSISPDPLRSSTVTDLLFDRLSDADTAAVEAAVGGDEQRLLDTCDPASRRRLLVNLGVHHEIPAVLEKTGLTSAMPPDDVHSMARGSAAAGGSIYYADMMVDGFAAGGFEPAAGTTILDFGCSSGRAIRPLAAAFPEAEWLGCDPIREAIDWAQANIDGAEFIHSPEHPPLPYEDESLDAAYAISIWSHFNAPAGERWLNEMRRLIRPGGLLLLTTHGFQTIPHDRGTRRRSEEQLQRVATALDRDGFWFEAEFGTAGDHGVMDPDWGTAFLTPEWLLKAVTPHWKVVSFAPGRVEDNQDLYVLERR